MVARLPPKIMSRLFSISFIQQKLKNLYLFFVQWVGKENCDSNIYCAETLLKPLYVT